MRTRLISLIVAGFVLSSCVAVRAQTRLTPREIINGLLATYKAASSYQDTGEAIVVETDPKPVQGAPRVGEILASYRTYFARPKMFRFDWKSSGTRSREASLWSDGKKIYQWMPSVGTRGDTFELSTREDLNMAIMDAERYSSGAVYPLISLFIKEANVVTSFADILDMATELAVLKEESVGGENCYVIKANLSGAPWTLWISKQRKIIRKTRTVYSYGSFDESVETGVRHEFVAEETRREIKINEPIAQDVFNYRPTLRRGDYYFTR